MNINSILTINNNHTHDGSMVLLEKWCAMDPINKNPGHMLAFFYQHHISTWNPIDSGEKICDSQEALSIANGLSDYQSQFGCLMLLKYMSSYSIYSG
jgi:hypothetical protein